MSDEQHYPDWYEIAALLKKNNFKFQSAFDTFGYERCIEVYFYEDADLERAVTLIKAAYPQFPHLILGQSDGSIWINVEPPLYDEDPQKKIDELTEHIDAIEDERDVYLAFLEARGYNLSFVMSVGRSHMKQGKEDTSSAVDRQYMDWIVADEGQGPTDED
jgi:hypothetical protein